jgi:hypothetical protein
MIEVLKQAYQLLLTEPHAPTVCDQLEVIFRRAIAELESQKPVAWKLMPRDATDAMLKAMDECSTEGYDERLYAGHAASVYMAAWDASDTAYRPDGLAQTEQEPVAYMRMPKVGDRVACIEDEDLGTVQSLTAGGSPDIKFDDGSHGTYLLREFAELFRYADTHPPQRTEQNFCPRCGKRTNDIHTCTPPQDNT